MEFGEILKNNERILKTYRRPHMIEAALVLSMLFLIAGALATAKEIKTEATLGFYTDYVWRGQVVNDELVLQPAITVTKSVSEDGSLSFNIWGNFDLTNSVETKGEFSEIDLIASYSHSFDHFGLEAGFIHYIFPNTAFESTTEVYLSANYEPEAVPLSFSLTVYYDFDEIDGFYAAAAVESNMDLNHNLSLNLKLSAGYGDSNFNMGYFGVTDSSFADCVASAVLTYKVWDSASISAGVQYMYLLGDALKDAVSSNNRSKFTGSLSVSYSF